MRAIWAMPLILMGCSLLGGRDEADVSSRGSVCGMSGIRGEAIGPVDDPTRGCGIVNAVRVWAVGGIPLSQPAVMECNTARVLDRWVEEDLDRIVGIMNGGVSKIEVAAHYACRTRNSRPGAKLSEHARGRAIDISGFRFADGSELTVADHWNKGRRGRILKRLHRSACGPFGTVLGPDADRFHRDHFHFDTATYRSGAYCR